jgi:uncharacterized membrane protein YecN with MAPEG domain
MANPILGTALMAVPVTALYGALNALLTLALGLNISRLRNKYQLFRGDGGHADLAGAVRAHGNNIEHVPLILILLLTAELSGGASIVLHIFGGAVRVAPHSCGGFDPGFEGPPLSWCDLHLSPRAGAPHLLADSTSVELSG